MSKRNLRRASAESVKRALENRQDGEIVVQNAIEDTQGIPLVGMRTGDTDLGKEWLCEIMEVDLPLAKDRHNISVNGDVRIVRANTQIRLTEAHIEAVENAVVETEREIDPDSPLWGKPALAVKANPGFTYVERDGRAFLVSRKPRFFLKKIIPIDQLDAISEKTQKEMVASGKE